MKESRGWHKSADIYSYDIENDKKRNQGQSNGTVSLIQRIGGHGICEQCPGEVILTQTNLRRSPPNPPTIPRAGYKST